MSNQKKLLDLGKVMTLSLFIFGLGLTQAHADRVNVIATISIMEMWLRMWRGCC